MAAMDRDTFIPLGTSIVKLLLIASGQGALATAVGEGAGLLAKFRRTLEIGGNRAVFAEKIADNAAKQLLREHQGISEADWHVAARQAASLIDRLSEKERLAAGYNWEELRRTLLDLGGTDLRSDLADESARQAFDWVLEVACQRIADCFTEKEALASILESVEEVRAGIQRLAERPAGASQTRAVVADHMEVVRDLAPDPLEDRERELAELETFVRGSQDTWYAMEAGMISGKTALMSSFTLNPPSDVHIVSFFIRRMGGDGNDWRSFSFVAGAQLAEILGDEYTERVSEPASQNTEFRQLLRRAATACQSDKNPRPLVLVIDGVDEDSYYEDPDAPGAKSILSLLPRHLPEGVKLVTASRPNPRMPEDIVCNASRVVVSLKPSPIAQEKINQKDIETFFKSDLAVDIGAFLAACGGSLTVDELRQLIARRRHVDNVPSRDVKACVDHSPGRMLMRVNVGFGDREIPSYTLGHDAVLRAVLREISPDLFGESDGVEEDSWWVQARERALAPYCQEIRSWVKSCAESGWGKTSPSYMLTDACFNLMFIDEKKLHASFYCIVNRDRYNEMLRRSRSYSRVLLSIDRECFHVMDNSVGEVLVGEMKCLLEVAELRKSIAGRCVYVPGLFFLKVSHFGATVEDALDSALVLDGPKDRVNAINEIIEAAKTCERRWGAVTYIPKIVKATARYAAFRGSVLRQIIDVLVDVNPSLGDSYINDREDLVSKADLLGVCMSDLAMNDFSPQLMPASGCGRKSNDIEIYFSNLKSAALCIADPFECASALLSVMGGYGSQGLVWECCQVMEQLWFYVGKIGEPRLRAEVLASAAAVLADVGQILRAREVAVSAERLAGQIDAPWQRAATLVKVADALIKGGMLAEGQQIVEKVLSCVGKIDAPWLRAKVLASAAAVLADVGQILRASKVAMSAERIAGQINSQWLHAEMLVQAAYALIEEEEIDQGIHVVARIDDSEVRADTLVRIVGVLAGRGLAEQARRIALQTLQEARQICDPQIRMRVLAEMASTLIDGGLVKQGYQVAALIDDSWRRGGALVELPSVLAGAGMVDQARQIAGKISHPWWRAKALSGVVVALAGAGMVDQARQIAGKISHPWWRAKALSGVVVALAGAGMVDQARDAADAAVNAVEQIADLQLRAEVLAGVAEALVGAGMVDQACDAADSAVNAVERITNRRLRAKVIPGVAKALADVGQVQRSCAYASLVTDVKLRLDVHKSTIRTLIKTGRSDRAVDLISSEFNILDAIAVRDEAADQCGCLAQMCLEVAKFSDDDIDRWIDMGRGALTRSWFYGASVWDHFDILMRVAPELAVQLVDERILADPEQGTAPESDPDLGPEGPGGDTGSYR